MDDTIKITNHPTILRNRVTEDEEIYLFSCFAVLTLSKWEYMNNITNCTNITKDQIKPLVSPVCVE